jgi:hypothetical protein
MSTSRSALCWDITRLLVVIVYRRFGTTYSDSWPVKMGPIRCPETSVNNYHTTPSRAQISSTSRRKPKMKVGNWHDYGCPLLPRLPVLWLPWYRGYQGHTCSYTCCYLGTVVTKVTRVPILADTLVPWLPRSHVFLYLLTPRVSVSNFMRSPRKCFDLRTFPVWGLECDVVPFRNLFSTFRKIVSRPATAQRLVTTSSVAVRTSECRKSKTWVRGP